MRYYVRQCIYGPLANILRQKVWKRSLFMPIPYMIQQKSHAGLGKCMKIQYMTASHFNARSWWIHILDKKREMHPCSWKKEQAGEELLQVPLALRCLRASRYLDLGLSWCSIQATVFLKSGLPQFSITAIFWKVSNNYSQRQSANSKNSAMSQSNLECRLVGWTESFLLHLPPSSPLRGIDKMWASKVHLRPSHKVPLKSR